jgi:hypothetical protein
MRAYLGNALLILLGIAFPFLILEVLVRALPLAALPAPLIPVVEEMHHVARRYFRADKELRHTIKRNTDFDLRRPEYTYRLKTNLNFSDAGFRGGTLRGIAWGLALGDSFTFGAGVNQEATWVAQLAAFAKQDVINLGVPGYGPNQYTRAFEKYGVAIRPRIVFYSLYSNDLGDCIRFEQWLNGRSRRMTVKRYLRENSVSYNLFNKLTNLGEREPRYLEVANVGVKLFPTKLKDPYELGKNKFGTGWALAIHQIEKAHEHSKRIGAKFVLLYFPSKEEVYWDHVKAAAQRFPSFEEWRDRLRTNVAEFCASRAVLCLDLSPALRARGSKGARLYYPIDIHWNETGHRVVAEEIYKFLVDSKILSVEKALVQSKRD